MTPRILVACIGNIFFGDDGFGVEVAQALVSAGLPLCVTVADYGIRGLDLAYALLGDWQAVILVDLVPRGGEPGSIYLLQPGDIYEQEAGIDPHSMDPVRVLATARSIGRVNADVYIVGCEPHDFGDALMGRMGLSESVAAPIPHAVKLVSELAERLTNDSVLT